ncbi:hypothetical protein BDF21DRAFT_434173 [Thamnidium elegans]|nr:hypothetical protein BDF21DRAFT_434173 [Thamnidium elegans]
MSQQVEYQDPILTPGKLRKIVQNLPGKTKDQHTEYEYQCDADTFENEINEFFKYTEVTVQLQEYRKLYEKEYNGGIMRRQDIVLLLDQLELSDQESRLKASKLLVYIALGSFTMNKKESNQDRIQKLMEHANLLIECGAFNIFYQKLQQSLDNWFELDLYLTLLYVLLESQRYQYPSKPSKKFKLDLVTLEPNLIGFLLSLVAKLREKLNTSFPVKKVILLLWKSLLFMSGGLESIKESTQAFKESFGLSTNPNIISKSTPQDLHLFQTQVTDKYPGYIAPKFPIDISSPLTLHASNTLSQAMGYANATNQIELLYQTLFPPKSSVNGTSVFLANKKSNHQVQHYFMYPSHVSPTLILPLTHQGSGVPESIKEAGQVFEKHMHTSLSNYQIIQERSKAIQRWKLIEETKDDNYKIELQDDDSIDLLEKIYANVIPDFQNIIIVLLKLLLTSVNTSNNNQGDVKEKLNTPENITLEYLEEVDLVRNREVYSKAISGILLLLLKWTKASHVLKFEYISQLLVDSGCLLLILKIIGLQEITDLVKAQTDIPYYAFFDYNINRDPDSIEPLPISVTNRRNMFWAINYLRVLQMLTKHKTHRVMLLAQYKSSAILKRMLKISHPVLELYTLKLLKSQVPYLGRKWRSQNMRIISAIYLNCYTVLKDDWISKINFDEDLEEGKMQEHNLRILTYTYNGERYLPSLLPLHDEVNTEKGFTPTGPGFSGFHRYDINNLTDEEEFDQVFLKDYKVWLESETFYNDTEEEIMTGTQVDTPDAASTPYPFNTPDTISHQQLTLEINKLYIQQLNQQFKPTHSTVSTDTWESPPTPRKSLTPLARYQGQQGVVERTDDEEYVQDAEDFMYQLMQVEDTTVKKWNDLQPAETKYRYILFDDELYYSPDTATSEDDDSQYSGTRG